MLSNPPIQYIALLPKAKSLIPTYCHTEQIPSGQTIRVYLRKYEKHNLWGSLLLRIQKVTQKLHLDTKHRVTSSNHTRQITPQIPTSRCYPRCKRSYQRSEVTPSKPQQQLLSLFTTLHLTTENGRVETHKNREAEDCNKARYRNSSMTVRRL